MKKSFKLIGFIAAAAMTVLGCAKEEKVDIPSGKAFTHTVTFHVAETKTLINEGVSSATFKWSSDDADRFYITETGVAGTGISLATNDAYATVTLSATFTQDPAPAEYTYAGFLSKNKTGAPYPKIPTAQTSTASTFDPDADILVAKSATYGSPQDDIALQFARPAVINKMTLKGLDEGETVSSVVVSADKNITGYFNTSTDAWSGQSSEITITTDQTVPASGQVTVYFVTMPVEAATLTVTVTTGNYIYSKTFASTIDFVQNQVTRFGVSSLTRNSKSDYTGTYVLTNVAGTKMAGAWASGNNIPAVDVVTEGGTVYYDPDAVDIAEAQIEVTRITDSGSTYYNMYTMEQNSLYLYAASSSENQLKGKAEADKNTYWEISETDGTWSIAASKSSNRNVLQNNGSIFSCYASASQTAVALHSSFAPTPVITVGSSIALTSAAVSSATSTGATFNSNTSTVTAAAYSDAECTVAATWLSVSTSGSGSTTTVKYTATANGTGSARTEYIKITASNGSRNISKVIAVTQAKPGSVTVWDDDFSQFDAASTTALTSLTGSKTGFTSEYSGVSTVYPEVSAIKFASSKKAGSITTPAFSALTSTSTVTVTIEAAGMNTKTGPLTFTVNNAGTASPTSASVTGSGAANASGVSSWDTISFTITNATSATTLTISAASGKQVFVNSINIVTN